MSNELRKETAMTEVPEVGSVWISKVINHKIEILFADSVTVYMQSCDNNYRSTSRTSAFLNDYKPAPRIRKYQRWVNLYPDGSYTGPFASQTMALAHMAEGRIACATRLIEWEVEE